MSERVTRIVIAGGGTAGWMTAAALSKVLSRDYSIRLVESDEIGIVGVGEATIPQIKLFNNVLELDEADFVRRTQGTFKLGIQFVDWARRGDRYIHGFGTIGQDLGVIPFHHYWLKRFRQGKAAEIGAYSINTAAAVADKFLNTANVPNSPLTSVAYAYHFDAGLYARYLRAYAEARGVRRTEGKIVGVEQHGESGFVTALRLASGERERRPADAVHPRQRAHRRLAVAHSAAAPHRQRLRLFERIPLRRRGRGDAARPSRRPGAGRAAAAALRHRPPAQVLEQERGRDRAVQRLHGAARIDQHPSDPGEHRAADQLLPRCRLQRPADRALQPPVGVRVGAHPRFPDPALPRHRTRRHAVLELLPHHVDPADARGQPRAVRRERPLLSRERRAVRGDELGAGDARPAHPAAQLPPDGRSAERRRTRRIRR